MKAIICPQCGGLIKKISEGAIADCGYCGAKVLIQHAETAVSPPPVRDTSPVPLENYKPFDDYEPFAENDPKNVTLEEFFGNQNETAFKVIAIAGAVGFIFFIFIALGLRGSFTGSRDSDDIPATPYRYSTPTPTPYNFITTLGNQDASSMPKPVVPKGVVIREPVQISVVVSVDETGAVYDAQSYDGPQALQKAAIEAAKKARFPVKNGQRSSGVLTYDFAPRR